jgi:non-specific serine/threonine protein kinase
LFIGICSYLVERWARCGDPLPQGEMEMCAPAGSEYEGPRHDTLDAVRVWLLGGFTVSIGPRNIEGDSWRLKKAAALVKLLALSTSHRLHREQAMGLLWPDSGRRAASNSLRSTLHAARAILDPAAGSRYLASEGDSLVLCPRGDLWVDVDAFEEAAVGARRSGVPAAHTAAINLYSGDLLPEDRYEEWAEGRRQELRQTWLSLHVELARAYEGRREYEKGIEVLQRALLEEPTNEQMHAGLMRLYAFSERRGEALAQYGRLCEVLSGKLGTEPSTTTRRLRDEIAAGRLPSTHLSSTPPEEPSDATKHNLPAARSSFVGREREMLEVKRRLAMTRLLTITGAGGSGKTRLALEATRDLVGLYPDGVWLVELAPVSEGALVVQVVANALGVREVPGRSLTDTLVDALKTKQMLLLLDNCEHLLDACAHLVDTLLASCMHFRILATSREYLGVAGESVWVVSSLSVPPSDRLPAAGELTRYDAVRLFVDRVRLRLPDFDLTSANGRVVAEVCTRLEGMPLAIELATARMGALAVEEIAQRLEHSLRLLTAGPRTVEPRHRTMRAALEWSHALLSEPERVLFRRLSVFAGGFTLEAAEAVCPGGAIEEREILDLLSNLVDKSLVLAETSTEGRVRYRMLEPVRQYAREQLEESTEAEAVRQRHATFFLALAKEAKPNLRGPQQVAWLERLEGEHDNIRAALSWSLAWRPAEQGERAVLGIRLASALWRFWESYGYPSEGRQWLERGLTGSSVPSIVQAEALNGAGYLALLQGDYQLGITRLEESIALFKELEDDPSLANSLSNLGIALLLVGDRERVTPLREDAEVLWRGMINQQAIIDLLIFLGMVALDESDYEQMAALLEEGLELSRDLGDVRGMTACLTVLGLGLLKQGNYERAALLLEECLYLTARRVRHMLGTAYSMLGLAAVAALRGQPARAARIWGAAEALREVMGQPLAPYDDSNYDYEGYLDAARSQLDEPDWKAAWLEGRTMTLEQAVAYALGEAEEPVSTSTPTPERSSAGAQSAALTRREEEIATCVAQGLTNRQIAQELSISVHTVANHVARILRKLEFDSRSQITAWVVGRRTPP